MKKVIALVKVVLEVDDETAVNNSDMLEELNAALNHVCGDINSNTIEVVDVDVYHAQPVDYLINEVFGQIGIDSDERISVASFRSKGNDIEKLIRRHCTITYRDVDESNLIS